MFINQEFYQKFGISEPSQLFELMSDILYFAKDKAGRFVCANEQFIQHFNLYTDKNIGTRTDFDIMPSYVAERIRNDDALLMAGKTTMRNQLELVPNANGNISWFVTTKSLIRGGNNSVLGVEGFIRDLQLSVGEIEPFHEFSECVHFIQKNLTKSLSIPELAKQMNMSVSQFERKFKKRFQDTPLRFIKRLKFDYACRALTEGKAIAEISNELGFTDQSYFTKEFKKTIGTTPKQYANFRRE